MAARIDANITALETLREIQSSMARPTLDQRRILSAWSGWGGLSEVFDERSLSGVMKERNQRLKDLLGPEGYRCARESVLTGHYTHPAYVKAIWKTLEEAGLTQGQVIEPGCGVGTFLSHAPQGICVTGVEVEETTADIAAYVNPKHTIWIEGYEESQTPHYFDAAIGNVPFGDIRLHDRAGNPGNHKIHNHFIIKALGQTKPGGYVAVLTSHFTLDSKNPAARKDMYEKADLVAAVRLPSGAHHDVANTQAVTDLLIFRRRKEGKTPQAFTWEHAQRVQATNGQLVPTDQADQGTAWVNAAIVSGQVATLGQYVSGQGMYSSWPLRITFEGGPEELATRLYEEVSAQLKDAASSGLAYEQTLAPTPTVTTTHTKDLITFDEEDVPVGTLRAVENRFERYTSTGWQDLGSKTSPKTQTGRELSALLHLRDLARSLVEQETRTIHDTPELSLLRASLHGAWEEYVNTYGPLSRSTRQARITIKKDKETGKTYEEETISVRLPAALRIFASDPYAPLTRAIEIFDEDAENAQPAPAPILLYRQAHGAYEPKSADNAHDALRMSLAHKGVIDLDWCAQLTGSTRKQVREELGTLIFDTPDGQLVSREEYLSGNVRQKLVQAEKALEHNPNMKVNVEALRQVLPPDLGVGDITPRLGATWIDYTIHNAFLAHLGFPDAKVFRNEIIGWGISHDGLQKHSRSKWSTQDMNGARIVALLMQNKEIKVTREEKTADGKRQVLDFRATEAAKGMAERIEAEFRRWIWEDPDRTKNLLEVYNQRFNSHVPRSYHNTGRELTLPGLSDAFTLRDHQRSAIARMISEPTAGLFHEVGAGKTLEMVCGIMEQKRLGLIKKPMVVVPNHLLYQWGREFLQAYPSARLLILDPKDVPTPPTAPTPPVLKENPTSQERAAYEKALSAYEAKLEKWEASNLKYASSRAELFAKATTQEWDAIITTQSAFKKLPLERARQEEYLRRQLNAIEIWLNTPVTTRYNTSSLPRSEFKEQDYTVSQAIRAAKRAHAVIKKDLEKLEKQADTTLRFEQLGVDYLVVDEAHEYKNLKVHTHLQGAISTADASRATDLDMKLDYLREHSPTGRIATLATATPIANSMGEMWVMTHYLRPDLLQDADLRSFDEWAAAFTTAQTRIETTVTGGLKARHRIRRFHNLPELLTMWNTFADVKASSDLDLEVPALAPDGSGQHEAQTIVVDAGQGMDEFMERLAKRARAIEDGKVSPEEDNFLALTGDGKRAAMDIRLFTDEDKRKRALGSIDPATFSRQKVDAAAETIARIYHENKDRIYIDDHGRYSPTPGALQLVFCDEGTPKDTWNIYDHLKELLIQHGIPHDTIAFAHDAKTTLDKDRLFAKARTGAISVLIGSTQKMGTGANMQTRALALHHLSAPWRPADLAQRDGRIIRQGNQNPEVQIYRYATAKSLDAYMWQTLERKAAFIGQIMRNSGLNRQMDDFSTDDVEVSYAHVKALASGNPLLIEEAEAKNDVNALQARYDAHQAEQYYLRSQPGLIQREINTLESRIVRATLLKDRITPTAGSAFKMAINGTIYTNRAHAQAGLVEALKDQLDTIERASQHHNISLNVSAHIADINLLFVCHPPTRDLFTGKVGRHRNIEVRIDASHHHIHTNPYGTIQFTLENTEGHGIITRIENHIQSGQKIIDHMTAHKEELTQRKADIQDQLTGLTNPWTDQLQKAKARLEDIQHRLHTPTTNTENTTDTDTHTTDGTTTDTASAAAAAADRGEGNEATSASKEGSEDKRARIRSVLAASAPTTKVTLPHAPGGTTAGAYTPPPARHSFSAGVSERGVSM